MVPDLQTYHRESSLASHHAEGRWRVNSRGREAETEQW